MRPLPIGICGHDGSGKSLLADLIREACGSAVISLATALREELYQQGFRGVYRKPTPPHLRALLRAWGWARRVEEGEDYWLNKAVAVIGRRGSEVPTVTDDVRHENEARWFAQNGLLIALHRPATDPKVTEDDPPIIREVEVAKRMAQVSIKNESTPEVLASWVPMIVREATGARDGIPPASLAYTHPPVL